MGSAAHYGKELRVCASADFQLVFKQSRKRRGPGFTLHTLRTANNGPRLGISVSKKQVKTAVARNRLKRLVRESFRLHASALAAYDFVFVLYREMVAMDNKTITHHLANVWDGLKRP